MIGNDPLYGPQSVAYNVWVASGDATMLYRVVGIDPSLPDDDDDDNADDDDDDDDDDEEEQAVVSSQVDTAAKKIISPSVNAF